MPKGRRGGYGWNAWGRYSSWGQEPRSPPMQGWSSPNKRSRSPTFTDLSILCKTPQGMFGWLGSLFGAPEAAEPITVCLRSPDPKSRSGNDVPTADEAKKCRGPLGQRAREEYHGAESQTSQCYSSRQKTQKHQQRPSSSRGLITPPEETNTGPGFNRGSEGGARMCDFEERGGSHAHTEGVHHAGHHAG